MSALVAHKAALHAQVDADPREEATALVERHRVEYMLCLGRDGELPIGVGHPVEPELGHLCPTGP